MLRDVLERPRSSACQYSRISGPRSTNLDHQYSTWAVAPPPARRRQPTETCSARQRAQGIGRDGRGAGGPGGAAAGTRSAAERLQETPCLREPRPPTCQHGASGGRVAWEAGGTATTRTRRPPGRTRSGRVRGHRRGWRRQGAVPAAPATTAPHRPTAALHHFAAPAVPPLPHRARPGDRAPRTLRAPRAPAPAPDRAARPRRVHPARAGDHARDRPRLSSGSPRSTGCRSACLARLGAGLAGAAAVARPTLPHRSTATTDDPDGGAVL